MGFALGPETPIIGVLVLDQRADPGRHLDQDGIVLAARLKQQNRGLAIGRQAIGQHATGRACADDDVVVTVHDARPFLIQWFGCKLTRTKGLSKSYWFGEMKKGDAGVMFVGARRQPPHPTLSPKGDRCVIP